MTGQIPTVWVDSYGGGTNSTATLCGMAERGIRPDLIMMANTANEWPHTYAHLEIMQGWCKAMGFPPITIVQNSLPQGRIDGSLFNECLRLGTLPSKTFGQSSCSVKWKVEPQNKFLKQWMLDNGVAHINHVIGYDMDEIARMERAEQMIATKKHAEPGWRAYETNRYLLIEWGWGREECIDAIKRFGLPQPGKSSCFMCPSSKKHEVIKLSREHPELYAKAVKLERRALAGEGQAPAARVAGLGRHWNWETLEGTDAATPEMDCSCYDGE